MAKHEGREPAAEERRGRFHDDEALKDTIWALAIDEPSWGCRRIREVLPEGRRPSYGTIHTIQVELGLETGEKRLSARRAAGYGGRKRDGLIVAWEHVFLETKVVVSEHHGRTYSVSFAIDRATASADIIATTAYKSETEVKLMRRIQHKKKNPIVHVMIGRGGYRRMKISAELEQCLAEQGTTHDIEGRWGSMSVHRTRLLRIIAEELETRSTAKEAFTEALVRYNEKEKCEGYPTFGETPFKAWVKLDQGKRPGVYWTTKEVRRHGIR
jgi:hypothetical protein